MEVIALDDSFHCPICSSSIDKHHSRAFLNRGQLSASVRKSSILRLTYGEMSYLALNKVERPLGPTSTAATPPVMTASVLYNVWRLNGLAVDLLERSSSTRGGIKCLWQDGEGVCQ